MLGSLISGYELTGDKRLLELADELGRRMLPMFNSPTGMPYEYVNLHTGAVRGTTSNPAEIGSLLMEYGMLARLTGKQDYYDKAKRAVVELYKRRSSIGLVGSEIDVETGKWTDHDGWHHGRHRFLLRVPAEGVDSLRRQGLRADVAGERRRDRQISCRSSRTACGIGQADMNTGKRTHHALWRAGCVFPGGASAGQ